MANSVDPNQTAVWSGSALFAQAYLSENLGSLRYSLKLWTMKFYHTDMPPKDAKGKANQIDPNENAPSLGLHTLSRPVCPNT